MTVRPEVGHRVQCAGEDAMGEVAYVSKVHIERQSGPVRVATLPGEAQPVIFSLHGEIAQHYGLDPARLKESHATTIDYAVAALGG